MTSETPLKITPYPHLPPNGGTELLKEKAQEALIEQDKPVVQAWQDQMTPTQQYHENPDSVAISTRGARHHATEEEILAFSHRLLQGDWGELRFAEDIGQNEYHSCMERGIVFGIYTTQDGAQLWAIQNHRFHPPTIMLPEER